MPVKQPLLQYDQVLRAWPQLRGHFRGRTQVAETELQAFFALAMPAITADVWHVVQQGLVRSQLLHQVAPGFLAFGGASVPAVFKPELAPAHVALWHQLQAQLVLPLGSLWSTRWLRPVLPEIPVRLVVEVNWAELQRAARLIEASAQFRLAQADSVAAADSRETILLRPVQRASPVRRIQGVTTARLEKMLVDAGQLPELATSDEVLAGAVATLGMHYHLQAEHLLQYAARCNAGPRWEALLESLAAA
ncbi:DUF6577 family protein [Hymenobacter algoricola]|uniref:Uncharacterized protein n=1 Tax=Hymenobacter algoricola TaxID=486267 RepID=A0ABP7MDM8_9BACT